MTEETTPLLGQLFRSFNGAGVEWVLLRGRAALGSPGRDVDLLVREEHLGAFEDIVFELGGVKLPASMHPWHRFYLVPDPLSGATVKLDVVTHVIYSRERRLASGLEGSCLDGRLREGDLYVLDPTSLFWTVLLHCVLDKRNVTERRASELESVVDELHRPSAGETFFETLCPPDWSADRAITCVHERDWDSLAGLGRELVPTSRRPVAGGPVKRSSRARRTLLAARRTAYPVVWRRSGLGTMPHVVGHVEAARVDGTILALRRRPGVCDVTLLVPQAQRARLESALRRSHYVAAAGAWNRLTSVGLERVTLLCEADLTAAGPSLGEIRAASLPVAGRTYCRRAIPGHGGGEEVEEQMTSEQRRTPSRPKRSERGRGKQVRVSFSGLDGAGKSFQIDALLARLSDEAAVEVVWVPFKFWPERVKNLVPRGFRRKLRPKGEGVVAQSELSVEPDARRQSDGLWHAARDLRGKAVKGLRSSPWVVTGTMAAISTGLSLRQRVSSSKADIVVLDRYRLDSSVKIQWQFPGVAQSWLAGIVRALTPAPDLEVLLRIDPEVAYARKAEEWSVKQLAEHAELYARLAAGWPTVVTVDADRDPDDIARFVWSRLEPVLDGQ